MISNCPKCAGQVTMPADGKADWQVKCPLCEQQFPLGEILEKLPPALIVISAPSAAPVAAKADDEFAAIFAGEAEATAGGDIFELDTAEGETPSFMAADSEAGPAVATAPSKATITALPRRKKKEKSIAAELVKIVLGGAAGLLIGYFLLLWIWKKDVLSLAPKFPSWAQWALPSDLRKATPNVTPISTQTADAGKQDEKSDESSAAATPDGEMPKEDTGEKTDVPETPKEGENTDATPTDDATANKDQEKPAEDPAKDDKAKKEKPIDQDDPLDVRPPDADKKADLPSIDEPKLDDPFKPKSPAKELPPDDAKKPTDAGKPEIIDPLPDATQEQKPAEKKPDLPSPKEEAPEKDDAKPDAAADIGLKISEKTTPEQIETAVAAATDAEKVLTPAEAAQKSAFTPEKYAAFGKVCEAVAAVTRAGEESVSDDKLKITVLLVTDDNEHATVIGQLANAWLSRSRKNDGIVLVGKVEEVSGEGPLKTVKVQLPALGAKLPATQVDVVAKELPEIKPQDAVNVTGVIVEKPADDIKGYKGENKRVVWATSVTKRDAAEPAEEPAADESK